MKKQLLLTRMLLLVALLVGSVSAWGEEETIASFTASTYNGGTTGGWTMKGNPEYATANSGYYKLTYADRSIVTPSINWSNYESITITISARKFGGPDAVQGKITVNQGNTELTNYSPSGTSIVSSGAKSISPTGTGTLSIACLGASENKGCGVQTIVIKGTPATLAYTITPAVNVSSMGSASVLGKVITATPNSGYRVKSGNDGYTVTDGNATVSHEGFSNTFTVTPSSNCTVQINFEEKENPTFAFEPTSKSVNYGEDVTEPALSTNSTGTVSYVSSNTNVATVDEDGQVTILAVGTTTITASITEDAAYKSANASYTLTVNEYAPTPVIPTIETAFYESFNSCNGIGGNDGEWSGTIASATVNTDQSGWLFANEGGAKKCVKLGTGSKKGSATTPTIDLNSSLSYTLTFRAGAWNGGSESTSIKLSFEAGEGEIDGEKTQDVTLTKAEFNDYEFTITGAGEGTKIKWSAVNASNNRFFLDDVKVTTISTPGVYVTVPSSGWGTFCSPYALDLGNAATTVEAYAVSEYNASAGKITLVKQTGKVPAKTPLVIKGEASSTKKIAVTEDATIPPTANILLGYLSPTYYDSSVDPTKTLMGMSSGNFVKITSGTIPANRAVLVMTTDDYNKIPDGSKFTFIVEDESETDGINNHNVNFVKYDGNIYNLAGQKVGKDYKGIVIVNGKKMLNK